MSASAQVPSADGRTEVSIVAAGASAGSLRLQVADAVRAWGGGAGRGSLALCDTDEDSLTLAWQASTAALDAARVDAKEISALFWATARPPFAEGPSHAFLAASLGIDPGADGALYSGSPHAGMEALVGAWDHLRANGSGTVLVVASDALVPGIGTSTETSTGAGAAALLLTASAGGPATLVARATRSQPVVDRYRADQWAATGDVYDPRLFREAIYLPLLTSVAQEVSGSNGAGYSPSVWSISDPDGKLASSLAKRLGGGLVSGSVQQAFGDTATASALLGLVHEAASDSGRRHVGVIGYGGGRATAVAVALDAKLPGASSILAHMSGGTPVSYTGALRARGQLEPMSDPIQMGLPPAGAAFARGNLEMLHLEGARCATCGTISTPPSVHPACTGCGGSDLEVVKLARTGTVVTFVVNQTMPPPFAAPLPLLVVDLADGARVMMQGTPSDAETLAVGDEVGLSLRRYALERGIPVYGYKASRLAGRTAGAEEGSALEEVRT